METERLEFWYNMAHGFLRVVQPRRIESLINSLGLNLSQPNDIPSRITENGGSALVQYAVGYIVCASIGVLLLLLLPLIGCFMCCCRTCCGKCGAKPSPPNDTDKYKRITYSIIILLLSAVNILAVCMAFITVSSVQRQTKESGGFMRTMAGGFNNVESYKNSTLNDLQFVVYNGVRNTNRYISDTLDAAPGSIAEELATQLNVKQPFDSLLTFVSNMNNLENNLQQMESSKTALISEQSAISTTLTRIRNTLKPMLISPTCNITACIYLGTTYPLLKEDFNFSATGDVQPALFAIRQAKIDRLDVMINNSINEFNQIATKINSSTSGNLNNIKNQMNQFERTVKQKFESNINPIRNMNIGALANILNRAAPQVGRIGHYIFVFLILFTCVLGVTFLLNTIGAALAFKCRSTDSIEKWSLRRVVSDTLLVGAAFTFVFTFFWTLITIVTFLIGGFAHNEVCRYMRASPDIGYGVRSFDQLLGSQLRYITKVNYTISILDMSGSCQNDKSLYMALDLESHGFDIRKLLNLRDYGLDKKLDELRNVSVDIGNVIILPLNLKQRLETLETAFNLLNTNSYYDQLNRRILQTDLDIFVTKLNETASINALFKTCADDLINLNKTSLEIVRIHRNLLRSATDNVTGILRKSPMATTIQNLNFSQIMLSTNGNNIVKYVLNDTAVSIWNVLNTVTGHISYDVRENIGRCRPVFQALNQIIDAPCYHLLNPVNGIWFAYGWCLFLLIPSLVFTIKLAGLLRKIPKEKTGTPDEYGHMLPMKRFQNKVLPVTPVGDIYNKRAVGLPDPVTRMSTDDRVTPIKTRVSTN